MKAAVLYQANTPLVIEEVDIEGPKAGEVQLRITATGICHSDLHNIKGEWEAAFPAILGHEGTGIVEALRHCASSVVFKPFSMTPSASPNTGLVQQMIG